MASNAPVTELDRVATATVAQPSFADQTALLEQELATYLNIPEVVVLSSGTAALHCALAAHHIGPGDEVIVPALAVPMSVAPILYLGAIPVVVDIAPDRVDFDYSHLHEVMSANTKAIMPVYMWGCSYNFDHLQQFCADHSLIIIEDSCQAFGSHFRKRKLGCLGDLGCYSLRAGKVLACGEGGFVATRDHAKASLIRHLRSHCVTQAFGIARLETVGYNYRMNELSAFIARRELQRADALIAHRRQLSQALYTSLADEHELLPYRYDDREDSNLHSPVFLTFGSYNARVAHALHERGTLNSVGSFGLRPVPEWPIFSKSCKFTRTTNTKSFLDRCIAPVILKDDSASQIRLMGHEIRATLRSIINHD